MFISGCYTFTHGIFSYRFQQLSDILNTRHTSTAKEKTIITSICQEPETLLILPIAVNILLIISNLLTIWGAVSFCQKNANAQTSPRIQNSLSSIQLIRCHHLLLPWLSLYLIYILFALGFVCPVGIPSPSLLMMAPQITWKDY